MSKQKFDVYETVTTAIIEAIENGAERWEMPWNRLTSIPTNARTGATYNGINVVSLWAASMKNGYSSPFWATFKQWKELGASVKKGEKSSVIIFYKTFEDEEENPATGETEKVTRFMARASRVFNVAQVEGWEEPRPYAEGADAIAAADAFVRATGADIRHGGGRAYYQRIEDYIQMPEKADFRDTTTSTATEGYYSTLLHELTHWTGAPHRLAREKGKRFGDEAYAFEELIAELGAAFLCAEVGITNQPREDHAAYIASWLKALKDDKRAIFKAARQAQAAADYLKELQPAELLLAA